VTFFEIMGILLGEDSCDNNIQNPILFATVAFAEIVDPSVTQSEIEQVDNAP